jgi:cysteinyl-tRNA synthetase
MMKIYNTLTRQKEEFTPIEKKKVKMYVCGPTVYDAPHIGHARSAYAFDVIRRYFEYKGFEVLFVRNVTDVDDKIIKKAAEELEELGLAASENALRERVKTVAVRYLETYHRELDILGIMPPTLEPKATDNIDGMQSFISRLIDRGYAYVSGEDVYFSVDKFESYGKLSNRNKDEMIHGVRVEVGEKKRHPLDFALWKASKPGEPSWESPWGPGRPGWHIECSVMSTKILGNSFDIHGGGLDLIFPHHENEIAQSEAATGKPFANYWVHNGLLTVNGEKMSKSLGNYITISDFLGKYSDPDLIKLAFSAGHYRSPMDYSDHKMEEARRAKERILIFFDKTDRMNEERGEDVFPEDLKMDADAVVRAQEQLNFMREEFEEAMDDDFNTPAATSTIFKAVKRGNDVLASGDIPENEKAYILKGLKNFILGTADILGLSLRPVEMESAAEESIKALVEAREKARRDKDYGKADAIRRELLDKGVAVEDTPGGPVWRKK